MTPNLPPCLDHIVVIIRLNCSNSGLLVLINFLCRLKNKSGDTSGSRCSGLIVNLSNDIVLTYQSLCYSPNVPLQLITTNRYWNWNISGYNVSYWQLIYFKRQFNMINIKGQRLEFLAIFHILTFNVLTGLI